jgi:plastocyanin
MRRWITVFTAVVALSMLVVACSSDDGGDTTAAGETGTTGETGGGATGGGGAATLTISDFAFDPSTLSVSAGDTLTITNQDAAAHTFTTDDGAIDQEVGAGETVDVTLEGVASGGFHCEIHPNMTGTLEVA